MAIKHLVFAIYIYIASLIEESNIKFEYISCTNYFKSKNNFKSSFLNHTHNCALKSSYSYTRV